MDTIILILLIFLLITIPLLLFYILRRSAEAYLQENKDNLVDHESSAYKQCYRNAYRLSVGQKRFDNIIYYYDLDKTVMCSSSVVSGAERNRLKYLFKYSNIEQSGQCMSDLNYCCDYVAIIEEFQCDFKQILNRAKEQIPKRYKVFLNDKIIYSVVSSKCAFDCSFSIMSLPSVTFFYRSPQGRSTKTCKIEMTSYFLSVMRDAVEENIDQKNHTSRQRRAMTKELREAIKRRDNYTCRLCGNSIYREPNLLLEIDHIVPVSKGGKTEASNLQTLCWKCNRSKSNS